MDFDRLTTVEKMGSLGFDRQTIENQRSLDSDRPPIVQKKKKDRCIPIGPRAYKKGLLGFDPALLQPRLEPRPCPVVGLLSRDRSNVHGHTSLTSPLPITLRRLLFETAEKSLQPALECHFLYQSSAEPKLIMPSVGRR